MSKTKELATFAQRQTIVNEQTAKQMLLLGAIASLGIILEAVECSFR